MGEVIAFPKRHRLIEPELRARLEERYFDLGNWEVNAWGQPVILVEPGWAIFERCHDGWRWAVGYRDGGPMTESDGACADFKTAQRKAWPTLLRLIEDERAAAEGTGR